MTKYILISLLITLCVGCDLNSPSNEIVIATNSNYDKLLLKGNYDNDEHEYIIRHYSGNKFYCNIVKHTPTNSVIISDIPDVMYVHDSNNNNYILMKIYVSKNIVSVLLNNNDVEDIINE